MNTTDFRLLGTTFCDISGEGGGGGGGDTPVAPKEEKDINFFDFDGTLVESYTLEEFADVTDYPAAPDHSEDEVPLTFDEWNWTIDEIKALGRPCDVGASYHTADGKTHMIVEADRTVLFSILLRAANSATIDWGDGVTETLPLKTANQTFSHTYNKGRYHIVLECDRAISMGGSQGTRPTISELYLPSNCTLFYGYAFFAAGIKKIVIPSTAKTFSYNALPYNYDLKCLVLPRGCTNFDSSFFTYCGMEILCLAGNLTSLASNINSLNKLKRLTLPDTLTSMASFSASSLREITFPANLDTIAASTLNHMLESVTILGMDTKLATNALSNGYNLHEINVPQGWVLNTNLDLSVSYRFSREKIVDLFQHLGRGSATITLSALTFGLLSASDKAIATGKGYTIASA